jgi:hypothetical protein
MKKIIFFGLLSFLLAAIWQLPLSYAKPYLEKMVPNVKFGEASGTIWKGTFDNLNVKNNPLGQLDWSVNPLQSLLSLSVNTSFKLDGEKITATGVAKIAPNKKITLNDTQFEVDASIINQLQKKAKLAGDIKGNLSQAVIHNNNLPLINGTIDWKEGAVTSPLKLPAGDYRAVITPESGDLLIKLSSSDAPAELNGKIKLNKEWKYDADIKVKAIDAGLKSMLKLVGKPKADGRYALKYKGDLSPFIAK